MKTIPLPPLSDGATYCFLSDGARHCTGSQMGRRNSIPNDGETVKKLRLVRIRFVDYAYDQGGAYWGGGTPLYRAYGESETEVAELFIRAASRHDAKAQCLSFFPNAKFYQ